uniref:Programmed cell death protein 2 C-terminal domain-containing protein n=1 Tax=Romanomermis culicivorax TaxID=13658 RepID=A0A915JVC9_ROMCU
MHPESKYDRGGSPLWATDFTPGDDIPDCSVCGAPRIFEFQVMPHLLHYLNVDDVGKSLDWATVAVYTCSESCSIENLGYSTEFVWKQDFSA